jgi:outer membrane lipoprotein SlyB
MAVITKPFGGTTMSNITTQVAKSSGFGEQPIRVGSSFSRPAAMIGGATALIALTAIATTLVVRPAPAVSDTGAEARAAAVAAQALMPSPSTNKVVVGTVASDKPELNDGNEKPAPKVEAKPAPRADKPQRTASNQHRPAANANTSVGTGTHAEAATPVAVAPAVCTTCGVVESVTPFQKKGEGSGVGAVAGGVLGGVVGHQVGGGNGRKAMTVLGAIGGGLAGNEIEKRQRATTLYAVKVRMEDGTLRSVTQSTAPTVGEKVTVDGSQIRARG